MYICFLKQSSQPAFPRTARNYARRWWIPWSSLAGHIRESISQHVRSSTTPPQTNDVQMENYGIY